MAVIIAFYFGFMQKLAVYQVVIILPFSVIGISGSFAVVVPDLDKRVRRDAVSEPSARHRATS